MKLTKKTDYAVRILIYLHRKDLVSIRKMAFDLQLSEDYSRKIIGELTKMSFIKTIQGINGGVELVEEPKNISIRKIIIKFERINICKQELIDCSKCIYQNSCKFDKILTKGINNFLKTFDGVTLQDLL